MDSDNSLATVDQQTAIEPRRTQAIGDRGIVLSTFEDAWRMAAAIARSDLAPPQFKGKPEDCLVAIQMGMEVGLSPLAALQNIAVINGRPSLWGDAVLAVCMASPAFDHARFEELVEGTGDNMAAVCRVARRGGAVCERRFAVADAKDAGLWSKAGPWKQYPKRMLQCRARSWALRDTFPDVMRGFQVAEEVIDAEIVPPKPPTESLKDKLRATATPAPPAEIVQPAAPQAAPDANCTDATRKAIVRLFGLLHKDAQDQFRGQHGLKLIGEVSRWTEAKAQAVLAELRQITDEPEV